MDTLGGWLRTADVDDTCPRGTAQPVQAALVLSGEIAARELWIGVLRPDCGSTAQLDDDTALRLVRWPTT